MICKQKIKEAEYQMRRLRDRGGNMDEETAVTMVTLLPTDKAIKFLIE